MKKKLVFKIIFVLAAILLLVWILSFFVEIRFNNANFEKKEQIQIVNNSVIETIQSFVSEKDFERIQGKIIFFNSWATWCGPCIKEIPLLNQLATKYKSDSNIVFVSYCSDADVSQIDSILKVDRELSFNFTKVDSKLGLRMSLRKLAREQTLRMNIDTTHDAVPLNLIIDSKGNIHYCHQALSEKDTFIIYRLLDSLSRRNNFIKPI